jgi:exodeoxyribonuclease VII large subunit
MNIDNRIKELEKYITQKIETAKLDTYKLISNLDAISPLKTLTRGYCIAIVNNKTIKSVKDIKVNDEVNIKFVDGERQAKVTK